MKAESRILEKVKREPVRLGGWIDVGVREPEAPAWVNKAVIKPPSESGNIGGQRPCLGMKNYSSSLGYVIFEKLVWHLSRNIHHLQLKERTELESLTICTPTSRKIDLKLKKICNERFVLIDIEAQM